MPIALFAQKNQYLIVLTAILVFGFYIRAYHIDYPVVGYHNWKEVHYLTEARNFARDGFFKHGFFVPEWDYPTLKADPSGVHSDTFPATPAIVAIAFRIFGYKLWIARLINIIFALGSVLFFYLIIKRLFGREDLALASAFIMAMNSLLAFFGRQVELLNPALFFCIAGIFFYLKWLEVKSWKNTLLFSFPLLLGVLTKYTFVLFAFPLVFLFPFRNYLAKEELKKELKESWKKYSFLLAVLLLAIAWLVYISKAAGGNISEELSVIDLGLVLSPGFWSVMKMFAKDNYTLTGTAIAGIGMLAFLFFYRKNKASIGYKFFLYYLMGSCLWLVIAAAKIQGHNYHQYPIMPLIVFFIAFFLVFAANSLSSILKIRHANAAALVIFALLLYLPAIQARNRMFDTQFYGLDVAGDYVSQHKLFGERAMHSSHQAYGFLWHADIKGTKGIPANVEDIKFAEEKLNASWIFIYQWDFNIFNEERWGYIKDNYSLKQVGFFMQGNNISPVYFLLRKSGSFDIDKLNGMLQNKPVLNREYETTKGKITLNYINLE